MQEIRKLAKETHGLRQFSVNTSICGDETCLL